ncbi:MAG TPA: DoxX family protein [Chthoniobacteraceae bacterium]|jgi:putative oxidoreductase|nr:DoxX family protein [Chthoniobacteraceae bacterium]
MASFLYAPETVRASVGLLLIRAIAGTTLALHGWPKIQHPFGWMEAGATVPGVFQACAALAEFGGGIALVLGVLTSIAALGIVINMIVALALVHVPHGDPLVALKDGPSKEPALLYLAVALLLLFTGPGAVAVDRLLFGRRPRY